MKEEIKTITWTSPEYDQKERSIDWFWAIGLITILGAFFAFYFDNFLFAVLILISGGMFFLLEIHTPHDVEYEINNDNFKMGKTNYPIKTIKYFDIKKLDNNTKIFVYTSDKFLPIKFIQIPEELSGEIEKELLKFVEKKEIQESHAVKFMEKLGF